MPNANGIATTVDEPQALPVGESRQCHSCQWAFRVGFSGPFQCRRNPPVVNAFMVPGRIAGQPQIVGHTSFPTVEAASWCGEFTPQPAIKGVT